MLQTATIIVCALTLTAPLSAQQPAKSGPAAQQPAKAAGPAAQTALAARPSEPCEQLAQACRSAGFILGDYKEGNGLYVDCLTPIMDGTDQPPTARFALPEVSPSVVAACKATGSNFGRGREPPPKNAQPDQPSGK